MTVARPFGRDCNTFLAINFSQLLINAVDSMGRRNRNPKSPYKGLNSWESFASVDRSGTPSWLGSDWLQTGKVLLHGEVAVGSTDYIVLHRPLEPAALIGNLNWGNALQPR